MLLSQRLHNHCVLFLHTYLHIFRRLFVAIIVDSFSSLVHSFGLHLFQLVTTQLVRLVWTFIAFAFFIFFFRLYIYFFLFTNIFIFFYTYLLFSILQFLLILYFLFCFPTRYSFCLFAIYCFEHVYILNFLLRNFCYDFHLLSDSGGFALAGAVQKASGILDIHTSCPNKYIVVYMYIYIMWISELFGCI